MEFTTMAQAKKLTGVSYLGGVNISAKMIKNQKVSGHYTYCIYLAPYNLSGYNVCQNSTQHCQQGCLATSGRAAMDIQSGANIIKRARIIKTRLFVEQTEFFMQWVIAEINNFKAKALKDGYGFSVRLNGTSDIDYAKVLIGGKNIFEIFPETQFYDYTKNIDRYINKPINYHLTFSYTGLNWDLCKTLLDSGQNVAMVFNLSKKKALPISYNGYSVTNGDLTDLRIDEAKGVIVGLYWKNIADKVVNAKIKNSIFAIQADDINLKY